MSVSTITSASPTAGSGAGVPHPGSVASETAAPWTIRAAAKAESRARLEPIDVQDISYRAWPVRSEGPTRLRSRRFGLNHVARHDRAKRPHRARVQLRDTRLAHA